MTGGQLTLIAVVGGLIVSILGLAFEVWRRLRDQAEVERGRLDAAYKRGRESRDDEVALITSERDDARRDCARAQSRADEYERRYSNLRDRGR